MHVQGYHFYITILYILASALALSIVLCIWVGWCFKNDRFPYVWCVPQHSQGVPWGLAGGWVCQYCGR